MQQIRMTAEEARATVAPIVRAGVTLPSVLPFAALVTPEWVLLVACGFTFEQASALAPRAFASGADLVAAVGRACPTEKTEELSRRLVLLHALAVGAVDPHGAFVVDGSHGFGVDRTGARLEISSVPFDAIWNFATREPRAIEPPDPERDLERLGRNIEEMLR
jgi:hypothetical protein